MAMGTILVAASAILTWRVFSLVGGLRWIVMSGGRYVDSIKTESLESRTGRRRRWEIAQALGGGRHWLLRPFGIRGLWLEYWSHEQLLLGNKIRGRTALFARQLWKWNWFAPAISLGVVVLALADRAGSAWQRWPMLTMVIELLIGSIVIASEAVVAYRRMGSWGDAYHDRVDLNQQRGRDLSEHKATAGAVLVAWATLWPAVALGSTSFGAFSPELDRNLLPGFLQAIAYSLPGLGGSWTIANPVGAGLAVMTNVIYTIYLVVIVQFFVSASSRMRNA